MIAIGDRVTNDATGDIGIVESMDADGWMDVRLLTPWNEPSCCVTFGPAQNWRSVPDDVIPFPMSNAWREASNRFYAAILEAITLHEGTSAEEKKT